jgi:outer membrane murein-binding lipoprotein Lpp
MAKQAERKRLAAEAETLRARVAELEVEVAALKAARPAAPRKSTSGK